MFLWDFTFRKINKLVLRLWKLVLRTSKPCGWLLLEHASDVGAPTQDVVFLALVAHHLLCLHPEAYCTPELKIDNCPKFFSRSKIIIKSNTFQSAINSFPKYWPLSGEQSGPEHITLTPFQQATVLKGSTSFSQHQRRAMSTHFCDRHVLFIEVVIFLVLILLLLPNLLTSENYLQVLLDVLPMYWLRVKLMHKLLNFKQNFHDPKIKFSLVSQSLSDTAISFLFYSKILHMVK